jgi:hypothetical protein
VTLEVKAGEPGVENFHFGQQNPTVGWDDMDGDDIDFRSSVLLLSRNI